MKPEFLKKLVDTSVDSGELINLEAEVRPSESVTSVTWQHEEEDVISSNGKKEVVMQGRKTYFENFKCYWKRLGEVLLYREIKRNVKP